MAAFKIRLQLVQGEDFLRRFTWHTGTPSLPVDLTGCTARMHMRAAVDSPTVLLALSTADGTLTLGGAAGTVDMALTNAVTAGITWASAVYDLEIVFASGQVRRLLRGAVTVDREVTRA